MPAVTATHTEARQTFAVVRAAGVHLYTIVGGILAFFALTAIAESRYVYAMLLLGIAFIIDGTDGLMARRFRVKEVMPTVDGAILDLVIDFVTYAIAPLFLLWHAGLLPAPSWLWAILILVAAHYDFANTHPLKNRGLYTGLPAIWNVYAFHVLYLHPSPTVQMVCITGLFLLTFSRVHFICLSRLPYLKTAGLVAIVAYMTICISVALNLIGHHRLWALIALAYPAWYLGSSFWVDYKFRQGSLELAPDTYPTHEDPV